jgi:guanosine-3',5'-bis(diphosphate) 3'-pyrophosphohydrolase
VSNHGIFGSMADGLDTIQTDDSVARSRVSELLEEVTVHHPDVDPDLLARAYAFAERSHRGQMRHSGDPFITHPLGCARICAGLGVDETAIVAALLHDTVEDSDVTLDEVEEEFGEKVRELVDGVTKLSRIHFDSTEEHQAENYRKLIVAMSNDIRVLVVKLADRLHNMRTLSYHKKEKRLQKARETLEIYAPLAHRLGMHSIKWELEDLAFHALHPKRYGEIQSLVSQRRDDREHFIAEAGQFLEQKLTEAGIGPVEISGRAKHFYSIYDKMTRKGKEFNEIYDLTAMRVLVDSVKDCYGAVGIVHSLWQPMPGRFKDYIAMPKINRYQSLHTTVIGPGGKPLEIQIRTHEMHRTAEFGVAAHWIYKEESDPAQLDWLKGMLDWQEETSDPDEFLATLRADLDWGDEVLVFTPKGDVKNLPAGSTPLDFAYAVHTDVGHQCVGAKVNGNIVPLTYTLKAGDRVEVLTSKARRSPSRDWVHVVKSSRAQSKIRQFLRRERREDAEHRGRTALQEGLRKAGLPSQRIAGSSMLAEVIKETGFTKATEFYVSLGMGKTSVDTVVNKVLHRLKAGQGVHDGLAAPQREGERPRSASASRDLGIEVDGMADVLVRLAKCCKPVPGDPIVGYLSLGRGITVHRATCPNAQALEAKNGERFTKVDWAGTSQRAFRVDIAVDAWDRARLLEDLSRALSEHGANIVTAQIHGDAGMVHDCFTVDIGDTETLKGVIAALRQVESVFDAYRLSPGS